MKKLSYNEYLAFLLIYAAYADQVLVKEEKNKILESSTHNDFVKMKDYFLELNDQQRLDLILENKSIYLPTKEKADQTLLDIKEVFLADHKYPPIEQFYYLFLKKFLD